MKLQVDATLQYAKGSVENDWWPQVSGKDRKIKSPYNTYLHDGLPPSPISNPGAAALYAAYNPQKTSCLFFLHDKNRQIHCTKTYEEHKKNIEIYLKWLRALRHFETLPGKIGSKQHPEPGGPNWNDRSSDYRAPVIQQPKRMEYGYYKKNKPHYS